jgi:drug/metabolite transporter (DMT)-like permease
MPKGRTVIGTGALAGSAVLVAIGIAYALHPDTSGEPPVEPVGWWLATLAFMGAIALGVAGLWQWRTNSGMRILFLVLIAGLCAIWTAANTLAILAYRQGPPDISRAFHWTGLAVSASLFLFALTEASMVVLSFRPFVPPEGERAV